MTKEEILLELQEIRQYMESKNAYHGYGQMSDLISTLLKEQKESHLKLQEGGWINVKDKPKKRIDVFVLRNDGGLKEIPDIAIYSNGKFYKRTGFELKNRKNVTHWMPLPKV